MSVINNNNNIEENEILEQEQEQEQEQTAPDFEEQEQEQTAPDFEEHIELVGASDHLENIKEDTKPVIKSDDWNYRAYSNIMTKQELFELAMLPCDLLGRFGLEYIPFKEEEEIAILKIGISADYDFIVARPNLHYLLTPRGCDWVGLVVANVPVIMLLNAKIKKQFNLKNTIFGSIKNLFSKKGKK